MLNTAGQIKAASTWPIAFLGLSQITFIPRCSLLDWSQLVVLSLAHMNCPPQLALASLFPFR